MINQIGTVFVHVTNLERSAAWYSERLGLPLGPIDLESPIYCPSLASKPGLVLDDNRNNIGTERDVRPLFAFETSDCEATLQAFKVRGVEILFEVAPEGRTFLFTFRDPFGNALMVMSDACEPVLSAETHSRVAGLCLQVGDLNEAARWYAQLLGLRAPEQITGDRYEMPLPGPATLTLTSTPGPVLTLLTEHAGKGSTLEDPDGTLISIRTV